MNNLIVRNQAELADAVEAIVSGIMDGLQAATDNSEDHALPPDDLKISGVLLLEVNAETESDTVATPETTIEISDDVPERTTDSTETHTGQTTNETFTPAAKTVTRGEAGGDRDLTNYQYESS